MARSIGLYASVTAGVLCAAGVGVILIRAATSDPTTARGAGFEGASEIFSGSGSTDVLQPKGISGATGLHVQVMDKDDPTRMAAELEAETLEPLQAQRYRVEEPRATLFLENGRVVTIESRAGTLVMPDRADAPESGRLDGDVVIRMYERPTGEDSWSDSAPAMVWTGETLNFDSTLGEASTDRPFVLTTTELEFTAADARVLINQTLERLERFTVRNGGRIVQIAATTESNRPDPAARGEPRPRGERPAGSGRRAEGDEQTEAPSETPAAPEVTFYQAAMRNAVTLALGEQRVTSDRLDLFARTVDNRLAEGAIGELGAAPAAREPDAESDAVPRDSSERSSRGAAGERVDPSRPDEPSEQPGEPATDEPAPPLTLTWQGSLEISPLTSQPPELSDDDLFARFTSAQSGLVAAEDTETGSRLRAAVIEHALTRHVLTASGPGQQSVEFSSDGRGVARMGHFVLPLRTGVAPIAGPGEFIDATGARVDWNSSAELRFHVADGRVVGELREAICLGGAEATDGSASIQAERLHAFFDDEIDGASTLVRLEASERASIDDGRGSGGPADSFVFAFDRAEDGSPVPVTFEANGSVRLRQPGARVNAEHLHAELTQDEQGDTQVSRAWAEGAVHLERFEDGIEITSQRLYANVEVELLEVEGGPGANEGDPPVLAAVRRGSTEIKGEFVHLHGVNREVRVRGAGAFAHSAGRGNERSRVNATWSEGMAFDDRAGTLACVGDVHAVSEPTPLSRDVIDAELVRVDLAPPTEQAAGEAVSPLESGIETQFGGDRDVLRVYAAGSEFVGTGDALATIESAKLRAAPDGGEPVLEQAFRLSGLEITADNVAETLEVPGRGRLFVADLREPVGEAAEEDDRGAALFDWTGRFHSDRARGHAEMHDGVQMSHTRAADGAKTVLEAGDLEVKFTPEGADGASLGGLRAAVATGDVYLRSNGRELAAQVLHYEPDAGIARALGRDGSRVRMLDERGAPTTASAITWDLRTDRVDVVDPGSIIIPRFD